MIATPMVPGQMKLLTYLVGLQPEQYVSMQTMAQAIGITHNTISKHVQAFLEKEWIEQGERLQVIPYTVGYRIVPTRLEELKKLLPTARIKNILLLVLQELADNQSRFLTEKELTKRIGVSRRGVHNILRSLEAAGNITTGDPRAAHSRAIPSGLRHHRQGFGGAE